METKILNPFITTGYAGAAYFCDREQETVDLEGNPTTFTARGRHDPCVLPRAVPIVEAMAAMTILDFYLLKNGYKG